MEMGGYAARIASHKKPFVVGAFVAQYFLIVVVSWSPDGKEGVDRGDKAPVLFSAAIYLSLSLTVRSVNGSQGILILRPKIILARMCPFPSVEEEWPADKSRSVFITADVFTSWLFDLRDILAYDV